MELQGFPFPANSPEPGACVRLEQPEEGLAVVVLDPPHRSLAVLDAPLLRDLAAVVGELEAMKHLKGVVFAGAEALKFAAGADIEGISSISEERDAYAIVTSVHHLFQRIERLKPRTVAAIGGPVPGGAYELSLSCNLIVAAEDPKTRIGLPETQLGILPGWGGSHRLPERIGIPAALDAILTGRLYPARQAWKKGMVDRLTYPHKLLEVAADLALGREKRRPRRRRGAGKWLMDRNPLAKVVVRRSVMKTLQARTNGKYPAPEAALDLVLGAPGRSREQAATLEAEAVAKLATGPVCKSLVSIFFASEAAKKLGRGDADFRPPTIKEAGVIGAGVMGGGIASLFAGKGIDTRLSDLSRDALDAAMASHIAGVEKKQKRRRLTRDKAEAAIDRLTASERVDGLGRAGIVVEAVAEVMEVKHKVLGLVATQVGPDCLLATNTSSLSVTEMAAPIPHPERVVGMHFFNPVAKMPLVEIVRGERTSPEAVTAIAALATRCGKTPVVVADVAGFLVNRLLGPYLDEAVRLFVEGVDPERLDHLMVDFGMPMGPLRLLDEVGLDIAGHAAESLHRAYGVRMTPSPGIDAMKSDERLGVKTGKGFYRHTKGKGKPQLATDLKRFQTGNTARAFSDEEVVDRMVMAMVNEAGMCLEEKVVTDIRQLDLATVFGTGFAPFRGGLMRYAEDLGWAEVVRRLTRIANAPDVTARPGGRQRFAPCPWIERKLREAEGMARDSGTATG